MARGRRTDNPRCGHCGSPETVGNGSEHGRKRWLCHGCGRSFGATTGTPLWGLKTPVAEVARALPVVLRRGSLRAAEEQTGHKHETIQQVAAAGRRTQRGADPGAGARAALDGGGDR